MYTKYREQKVFGGLDGLRFFSISAVVWHHAVGKINNLPITGYGFLGVDLFFVISGFLIVTLLLRESDKNGCISLKAFYIRRSLRIFPLYYGYILALACLYFFLNRNSDFGSRYLSELPVYLFYLANFFPVVFGIVWSLATEEQFYLLWPFLEKFFKKHIFYILAITLVINQFFNFNHAAIAQWLEIEDLSIFQSTFTPILVGVGLAHLLHDKDSFETIQIWLTSKYSAVFWLAVLVLICSFSSDDISGFHRLFIHLTMAMLVGSVVVNDNNTLMPLLKFPPIARIGVISYGIYLFHIHGIVVAEKVLHKIGVEQVLATFALAYSVTYVAAEFSYRLYETRFLTLKARFSMVHQEHT